MTGTWVGSYRILEKLGQGGMGEVYMAEDSRLKRLVAIKILRQDKATPDEARSRFLEEARAASALNHPNIVQVYELESEGGRDFIVMELASGRTLAQLLADRPFTVDESLDYFTQMASALAAAHAAGIVHRDIKPGNIMISDAGVVKVLDFGLAKLQQTISTADSTLTASPETAAGTVIGTPSYMSPEQAEGKRADARSDIFSMGAVLYEMLTGKRAFDGDSTATILSKVLRDQPAEIRSLRADVPPPAARIAGRCLGKEPRAPLPIGAGTVRGADWPAHKREGDWLSGGRPGSDRSGSAGRDRIGRLVLFPLSARPMGAE